MMTPEEAEVDSGHPSSRFFEVAALTNPGKRRPENQDRYLATPLLIAVADGVGGSEGGAEAASAAITRLTEHFSDRSVTDADADAALAAAFAQADADVRALAQQRGWGSSGTTLTCLASIAGGGAPGSLRVAVGHIGDSRGYLLRAGEVHGLTEDHVVPIGEGQRRTSALARCLGGGVMGSRPDIAVIDAHPGDRFLVCSDGLTKEVQLGELTAAMRDMAATAEVCEHLMSLALDGGGRDNITIVVADVR